jgi:hypothetical protein
MANFEIKFKDCSVSDLKTDYIKVESNDENFIEISGMYYDRYYSIWLDKSTAIKFAKTLRTEINKITESEAKND